MEDFLSVTDDYKSRESAPGKKRVNIIHVLNSSSSFVQTFRLVSRDAI